MLVSRQQLSQINRYQAFAYHIAISLLIFVVLSLIVRFWWYPGILFESEQGWKALLLIAGVDLVLGPVLTLMVFNPTKKSLPIDLAVIGLIQILALGAGSYTIHQNRPIALILFGQDAMTLYSANLDDSMHEFINQREHPFFWFKNQGEVSKTISAEDLNPMNSDLMRNEGVPNRITLDLGLKENSWLILNDDGQIVDVEHLPAEIEDEETDGTNNSNAKTDAARL